MFFKSERELLKSTQNEAQTVLAEVKIDPQIFPSKNLSIFLEELRYTVKLIFKEKEIIFFAILQWLIIGLAYLMFLELMDLLPDRLWRDNTKFRYGRANPGLRDYATYAFSSLVVVVASYPMSILNAAMVNAHYLHTFNQQSNIAKCIIYAVRNINNLWIFNIIDAWNTVKGFVDRLTHDKKERNLVNDLFFYSWKIGTIGILPALASGQSYVEAAKNSIQLLRNNASRTIGIRMGYSRLCRIIGFTTYILSLIYYFYITIVDPSIDKNKNYHSFLILAVPLFITVGVIFVFVRPFYLIMISKLYTDTLPLTNSVSKLSEHRN
jgi:hypothetical protein